MTTTIQSPIAIFLNHIEAIKGCKWISFTYTSSAGEVSKVVVNIGVGYSDAKTRDTGKLAQFAPQNALEAVAKEQLHKSLTDPDKVRSQAQKTAVVFLIENRLGYCPNTKNLLVWGMVDRKTVVVPGTYKEVSSSELTLTKNKIRKELNFSTINFKRYNLENITSFRINGETIEIE